MKQISGFLFLVLLYACQDSSKPPSSEDLFQSSAQPVFESSLNLAADPSMLRVSDTLFMYYSAADYEIGVVYSIDNGLTWLFPDGNNTEDYGALSGRPDEWDQTLETIDVVHLDGIYYMYYTGYREGESDNEHVANYEIGLATSTNGIDFVRHPLSDNGPILRRDTSINANDRHAMTSPAVQYVDGTFYMTYTGWNVAENWTGPNAGFRIMGATSSDGINWTKISDPLIKSTEISYSSDINESALIYSAENNTWYIPFSTDRSIGIARSQEFDGPYDIYNKPIISPNDDWNSEVTAPDGLIENGKLRLWYHGVKEPNYWPWVIGYSEAEFPLEW